MRYLYSPSVCVTLFLAATWIVDAPMVAPFSAEAATPAAASATGPVVAPRALPAAVPSWRPWSDDQFSEAKRQNKLVILDLEAVWCHWCHVMDQTTYADAEVRSLLRRSYLAVRVDQDSRPDLATRYQDYGWPATIIFDGQGHELAKRSGYIEPAELRRLLAQLRANPTAEVDAAATPPQTSAKLPVSHADLQGLIKAQIKEEYDPGLGGWKQSHKYLDRYFVELETALGLAGEKSAAQWAQQTLKSARLLLDPVWGGAYQYSVGGTWNEPHFEKIMPVQSDFLLSYALAFAAWKTPEDREVAEKVASYLQQFLSSPDGAFYVSQDADVTPGQPASPYFALGDPARRKLGLPKVDLHTYARETALAAEGLVRLADATGDAKQLDRAKLAAQWLLAKRKLPGGGFAHGSLAGKKSNGTGGKPTNSDGPYLDDSLAAGRVFLALYGATAEREWLKAAEGAANFIDRTFAAAPGKGFYTTPSAKRGGLAAVADGDLNIQLARFANLLFHYTGQPSYHQLAEQALAFAQTPDVYHRSYLAAGVWLAAQEVASAPLHLTVVGSKQDPKARALFAAAVAYPSTYARIEWKDAQEGPLPNSDVDYPQLKESAAFACSEKRCSVPFYKPDQLRDRVDRLRAH